MNNNSSMSATGQNNGAVQQQRRDDGRVELGIAETAELPLAGRPTGIESGVGGGGSAPVLPGGRTFDISISSKTGAGGASAVTGLFLNSTTPTDGELGLGLTPPYSPPPEDTPRSLKSKTKTSFVACMTNVSLMKLMASSWVTNTKDTFSVLLVVTTNKVSP